MSSLNATVREASAKGKRLRREGQIPAVLFGKHMDESVSLQIPKKEVEQFLRYNAKGSKFDLIIGKKKHMALLKDVTYTPASGAIEHLSFLEMKAGEKVQSIAHVVLLNEDKVDGLVQQPVTEIPFKALPSHLVERIEIDLAGKKVGDTMTVAELDIATNEHVEVLIPTDSTIYAVHALKVMTVEEPAEGEETAEAAEAAEEPADE